MITGNEIVASKKTLNAQNLEALGASRLAELLIECSEGDAATKRRLRLELAAVQSPADVASQIRKRLKTIARSQSFLDRIKQRQLVDDLETQRRAIVELVAKRDTREALELIWQFMGLAIGVLDRCDGDGDPVADVFGRAKEDLGECVQSAHVDSSWLADQVFDALMGDFYGLYDDLIATLAPSLGQDGLNRLRRRMIEASEEPEEELPHDQQVVVGFGPNGPIHEDELRSYSRETTIKLALREIADAAGDVDAFTEQYDEQTKKIPYIAAEISTRLVAAGRAEEALKLLDAAERRGHEWQDPWVDWLDPEFEWQDARIEAFEALGRSDDAQAARWTCFETFLSPAHLRAYLGQLPDFDDIEEEMRALEQVQNEREFLAALAFLISWPAHERAAALVVERTDEIDGDHYEILTPAADALADCYPLAATLLLRAMIDFSLNENRTSRYRHTARHFMRCADHASSIEDYGAFETHEDYAARMAAEHGRKHAFWSLVS